MKNILILFLVVFFNLVSTAQTDDPVITKLFQDSYHLIRSTRKPNGIYIDALSINTGDKPAAIVANGVGLVSLCIADAMYKKTQDAQNWEANAPTLVNQTLETLINFKKAGATNSTGMFKRYFKYNTGFEEGTWPGEYSTIDNGILAVGLHMCKNYFPQNSAIVSKVEELLEPMDFTAAITNGKNMYMILDQNGVGSAQTSPFNEYIIVAWLAKNACKTKAGYARSQTYWNSYFQNPKTAPIAHKKYGVYETITDGDFISSFIPQFAYYYCQYYKNNTEYMSYFNNALLADKQWWTDGTLSKLHEWGLGAGETPGGGYSADKINTNPNAIVSPHIIAGFIPINPQSKNDLKTMLTSNQAALYSLPANNTRKVLWRYSLNNPNLRCGYIQLVDFSTTLYGLATLPEYLGANFFNNYNTISCAGTILNVSNSEEEFRYSDSYLTYEGEHLTWHHPNLSNNEIRINIVNISGQVVRNLDLKTRLEASSLEIPLVGIKTGYYTLQIETSQRLFSFKYMKD